MTQCPRKAGCFRASTSSVLPSAVDADDLRLLPLPLEGYNGDNAMNSTYNITLKLGSLLSLPSRFIARIRRLDEFLNQDIHLPVDDPDAATSLTAVAGTAATHAGARMYTTRPPPARDTIPYEFVTMPGPLAFLTSGYAVGLVVMVSRLSYCRVMPLGFHGTR